MIESLIIHGTRDLFRLSDPPPRLRRSRGAVDSLQESWQAPSEDSLRSGDVHPLYPGMIIDEVESAEEIPGKAYLLDVTSMGSYDGTMPTKVLGRGRRRALESGWDERARRVLSWHASWKDCTGIAADGRILCQAHGFPINATVVFARKTGASGIVAQSATSLGQVYHVISRGTHEFKVSATRGGAPVALGTDMTAGQVILAEFALGAPHPDCPTLFLAELNTQDDNTDWAIGDITYRGLEEDKPYHRQVTINGNQSSSSKPITVDLVGGWLDPRNSSVTLPEIVVTDTYLANTALPTASIPSFLSPPNAPSIASFSVSGEDADLVYNWPFGWSLISCPDQSTISSLLNVRVYSLVYKYIWPVSLK